MTNDQKEVLELAKKYGIDRLDGIRDDGSHGYYYEAWEDQLLAFSAALEEKHRAKIAMLNRECWKRSYQTRINGN